MIEVDVTQHRLGLNRGRWLWQTKKELEYLGELIESELLINFYNRVYVGLKHFNLAWQLVYRIIEVFKV